MRKDNLTPGNFRMTRKDIHKIAMICQYFEELCKAVLDADLLKRQDMIELKLKVEYYNSMLGKEGD